jgi:hypothetical protein
MDSGFDCFVSFACIANISHSPVSRKTGERGGIGKIDTYKAIVATGIAGEIDGR